MLIEAPYKVGDIVSIKLSSGEEMVATLQSETDSQVEIRKPLMLVAGKDSTMGLAPFMFTVGPDAKYKIKLNSIICIVKTEKDASSTYTQSTSGLAVVN
jgi:hypothetical protein